MALWLKLSRIKAPIHLSWIVLGLLAPAALARADDGAGPALCDEENALGSPVLKWPVNDSSEFANRRREFTQKWHRTVLDAGSARQSALLTSDPSLRPGREAREYFFADTFGENGDIVKLCAKKRALRDQTSRLAERLGKSSAGQCDFFTETNNIYASAAAGYQGLIQDLKAKYGYNWQLGARIAEYRLLRHRDADAAASAASRDLALEAEALWGRGEQDSRGLFSKVLTQAGRELSKDEEAYVSLRGNGGKLAMFRQNCGGMNALAAGTSASAVTSADNPAASQVTSSGNESASSGANPAAPSDATSPRGGSPNGSGSDFLQNNWGWIAAGAAGGAAIGVGAYVYESNGSKFTAANKPVDAYLAAAQAPATPVTVATQTSTSTATSTSTSLSFTGSELEPLQINFSSTSTSTGTITATDLPAGAAWDPQKQLLSWLPSVGQAGAYTAHVQGASGTSKAVLLNIFPRSKLDFLASGPPDHFNDGDVGYVFIHGTGSHNTCTTPSAINSYWGASPTVITPDSTNRLMTCYDQTQSVASQAAGVAQQIVSAPCGRYGKCIVISHSMGGLMIEHILTHAQAPLSGDPNASLYANADLFKKARDRILLVISLASAAGGTKVADIVSNPKGQTAYETVAGEIADDLGSARDAAMENLQSSYASSVVAPMTADPLVPIFMVAGYSKKTFTDGGSLLNLFDPGFKNKDPLVFNASTKLSLLDYLVGFSARSDGCVDFRSSCGVADSSENGGPGTSASLAQQFQYCYTAPKKPNHYVWFLINLNHADLSQASSDCALSGNPCQSSFPSATQNSFTPDTSTTGQTVMAVIRSRLTRNLKQVVPTVQKVIIGF